MAIRPQTDLFLVKCPLQLSNKHQITFTSKEAQYNYFHSLPRLEVDEISYVRKDNYIRYPAHIDSLLEYNYCYYQNENYSDKWFYAFIVRMEYVNDNCTYIYIKQDVWQTWQFDLVFLESFVEREMINVASDLPGANLVPESLEIGEPKISGTAEFDELEPAYIIAFAGQQYGNLGETISQSGYKYNGILSGITFFLCSTIEQVQNNMALINADTTYNSQQNVITIFSIPRLALKTWVDIIENPSGTLPDQAILVMYGKKLTENWKEPPITKTLVSTPSTIDGYTPRNQKLRQYPYLYLGFNPPNGTNKIYRYEDFTSGTPSFKIMSEVNPNPSVYFIPQNYRGQTGDSLSDCVALSGYPTVSYKTDTFNSWLAQNSSFIEINRERENLSYNQTKAHQALSLAGNAVGAITSGLSGSAGGVVSNMMGAANTGVEAISNEKSHELNIREQMAQIEAQQLVPDNVTMSSSNATLLGYEMIDKNIFTRYNIKRQFAEKIDKYFDAYRIPN